MTNRRRIFWTVAIVLVTAFFMSVYNNFMPQEQADLAVDQLNGGDLEYGVARVASRDYSGYVLALMALWLICLWAPVVYRKLVPVKNA